MKLIYLFIVLFINSAFSLSAQTLEKSDTVYFYFNHKQYQTKKFIGMMKPDSIFLYEFAKNHDRISLTKTKYPDFDAAAKDRPFDVKILKKCFLRKHKYQIIDIDFILKNGFRETFFLINRKKIYLIDDKEIRKGKVIARQVHLDPYPYMTE